MPFLFSMQKNLLIFTAIIFVLEFYVFQAFKMVTEKPWARTAYWIITVSVYALLVYLILSFSKAEGGHYRIQFIVSLFLIFVVPKLLAVIFLLIDDLFRLIEFGTHSLSGNSDKGYPGRRKFLGLAGLGLTGLFAILFTDGILFGKYRHTARKVKLKIPGLPESFKGYRIVQISDIHSGSFKNPEKLYPAIDLINEQNPDLVLATGDTVNNYAEEFIPFIPLLSKIQSKDGKFSVLGNHDYGHYAEWHSKATKDRNVPELIRLKNKAGFETLRNEHRIIERNGEKLYLIGVENWGLKPFPQYGDLDKATKGIPPEAAKILMSHDPSHFDEKVKDHPSNIQLTVSGHTHGMQFGLDLKNIKWSPVQYRYKKWADLYESAGKFLYVNRGFGVIGYPGRVGILPEITVFELS